MGRSAKEIVQNPTTQWVGILTAVILAAGEAYLSRDASIDLQTKSAKSEDVHAEAIEANARAISAGAKGLAALQKDRELLEIEFRKAVEALQAVVKAQDAQIRKLIVDAQVEARLREELERRTPRRGGARSPASAVATAPQPQPGPVPSRPSPEIAALEAPKETGKASAAAVKKLKGYAQPRLVPRVWAKKKQQEE